MASSLFFNLLYAHILNRIVCLAKNAMSNGIKPIIIDNTNIYARHMQAYITQVMNFLRVYLKLLWDSIVHFAF